METLNCSINCTYEAGLGRANVFSKDRKQVLEWSFMRQVLLYLCYPTPQGSYDVEGSITVFLGSPTLAGSSASTEKASKRK